MVAVTTALCADRAAAAAPATRPHVTEMAGRLVMRLAQRMRRIVAAVRPWQERLRGLAQVVRPAPLVAVAFVPPRPVSPFQFRLPPPTV